MRASAEPNSWSNAGVSAPRVATNDDISGATSLGYRKSPAAQDERAPSDFDAHSMPQHSARTSVVLPNVETRAAARKASRGELMTIYADAQSAVSNATSAYGKSVAVMNAEFESVDALDFFDPSDAVAEQIGIAYAAVCIQRL